ncbi:MAG: hypothetical protein IJ410_06565 [Oscillospiraceae bacterium]|nr:hypothetical protein [Oscillospiraceae bacterium]
MFRLTGFALIILSSFFAFYYSSIADRCTYTFLLQTAELLGYLSFENISGRTYPEILNDIDYKKLYYYKNFDFCSRDVFFEEMEKNHFIHKKEVHSTGSMLSQIGQRTVRKENEYISRCITVLQQKSDFYRSKYEKNNKINRIGGLSIGLIVMIVFI